MTPVLNVSQRFPASRLCAAPVIPLARHPHIDNRVIVFDLTQDPQALLDLDAETIAARLYVRTADLAKGEERIARTGERRVGKECGSRVDLGGSRIIKKTKEQ